MFCNSTFIHELYWLKSLILPWWICRGDGWSTTSFESSVWLPLEGEIRQSCLNVVCGGKAALPYCDAVSRRDETTTIKPIKNEAFVASSGDIITDYNDLYCLFTCRIASHRVNIKPCLHLCSEKAQTKYFHFHNETQRLQDMVPAAATILQRRLKITPPFYAYTFGRCYANLPTSWRRCVGCVWMSCFRREWQSLNFDKEYLWVWDFSLCNFRDLSTL